MPRGAGRMVPLHGWVYLIKNDGGEYSKTPVKVEAAGAAIDVLLGG